MKRLATWLWVVTVIALFSGSTAAGVVVDTYVDVSGGDSYYDAGGGLVADGLSNVVISYWATSSLQDVVHTAGGGYTIDIYGTINAYNFDAVEAEGDNNTITNHSPDSINAFAGGDGIVATGDYSTVLNEGQITSEGDGIVVGDWATVDNEGDIDAFQSGIAAGDHANVTNHEGATIESDTLVTAPACGIEVGDDSIVTNSGLIDSLTSIGIDAGDRNLITNTETGTIYGSIAGIAAGDGNTIVNDGDGTFDPETTDPQGVVVGSGFGIVVQVDTETITGMEGLAELLYANVDPDLTGNTIINSGWVNFTPADGPQESYYGIFGMGNNSIINTNATFGLVAGIAGLQGNTITNTGMATGILSGVLIRNDNTLVNSGSIASLPMMAPVAVSGVIAGVGNTITNAGHIGIFDPALGPVPPSSIGILAYDNNTITNSNVIAGLDAGILVTSRPMLESLLGAGAPEELELPDYLSDVDGNGTDYVPVGNTIVNAGTIYVLGGSVMGVTDSFGSPYGILIDSRDQLFNTAIAAPLQVEELPTGGYWNYVTEEQIGSVFFNQITNGGTITSWFDDDNDPLTEPTLFFGSGIHAGDFSNVLNNGTIDVAYTGISGGWGNYIVNNGEIYSDQQDFTNATGIHVENMNYVENNGLIDSETSFGIIAGSDNEIVNNDGGTINASDVSAANGIDVQDGNTVTNYGAINALYDASVMLPVAPTPHSHGIHGISGNDFTNYGTIIAGTAGMEGFGDDNDIVNADGGLIKAIEVGISAGNPYDVASQPVGNRVTNEGQIGLAPQIEPATPFDGPPVTGIMVANQATVINGCADGECDGTIHAQYAGIATGGYGDVIDNYGSIYIYGGGTPNTMVGSMVINGDAGITVGGGFPVMMLMDAPVDTTPGAGDHAALEAGIINTVTNYGLIDTYYEESGPPTGAAGIRAYDHNAITNAEGGVIDAFYDGIIAGSYNIVQNDGEIYSDRQLTNCGIDVDSYNLVENTGLISSFNSDGISAGDHNEITNSGFIVAAATGISAQNYNIVHNTTTGEIFSDLELASSTGIHVDEMSQVTNDGLVWSETADGIRAGWGSTVTNSLTGTIYADGSGVYAPEGNTIISNAGLIGGDGVMTVYSDYHEEDLVLNRVYRGIYATGGSNTITNTADGEIYSERQGIKARGNSNTITNDGLVDTYNDSDMYAPGIYAPDDNNTVVNSGTINAMDDGIFTGGNFDVTVDDDPEVTQYKIINTADGVITAGEDGITSDGVGLYVVNRGSITGYNGVNFCFEDYGTYGDDTLINSGTITSSGGDAIKMGAGNDTVIFEDGAVVNGNTLLGMGDDLVRSNGAVTATGQFRMGENNDTLTVETGTLHILGNSDSVFGSGDDTLNINDEATLDFDFADDFFAGGNDTANIWGTSTNDLNGGPDNDTFNIYDGASAPSYCGGSGDDSLTFYDGITGPTTVSAFEQITKEGAGLVQLIGDNWGNGIFDLTAGTVQVDGDLAVDDLYIFDGATLAGNGYISSTLEDTVYNGGTVAPGPVNPESLQDHIGTLEISGSFVNFHCTDETTCDSGNLDIELYDGGDTVNESAQVKPLVFIEPTAQKNDEIRVYSVNTAVFGDDSITPRADGGTVTAIPLNYIAEGRYTFLYSDNLVVNEEPTVNNTALLNFSLGYDDYDMWLDVTRNSIPGIGGNENDQTIFDVINDMAGEDPDGPFGGLLEQLVQEENPDRVLDTLGLLSPEQYPNLLDVSMAGFELYRSGVLGRMGNLHLTRGAQDLMYADNSNTLVAGDPAMSRLPAFQRTPGGWSGWARVLGMTGDQDSDNGKLGFNIDSYGLALGFDNQINDNLVLGIGGGYTNNDVDFDDIGQDTESDSYHVSLYGSYSNSAWYLDGAVLYAASDYDTDRLTPGTKATSSTDSTEWGVYVGGGYNLVDDTDWYFIPTASAQWAQVDIDGFTEKDAGPYNLKVDDYDTDSLVTTLGFRIGANMAFGETKVEPEFRLSWAHEFGDTDRDVNAMFAMGGPSFTINGVEPDEDSALVGAGLNAHMTENFTIFVDYDGEFRSDFDAHMLSGGLRYNF